ncbi:hypothetical protein T4B_8623 [Trichinella pseudospiralis]|uniref:Uncharacterized protein n=1 Tax=Trichinella pseudospiralis TaxID=6337 RepID=A0A0V1IUV0_TRIPS|nr:hypothetical protein T4B_8623 [Trichinella pseudospiralis]
MKHNSECTDNGLRTLICPEEFPIKENLAGILQLPLLHYHTKMREILRNISTFYFIKFSFNCTFRLYHLSKCIIREVRVLIHEIYTEFCSNFDKSVFIDLLFKKV